MGCLWYYAAKLRNFDETTWVNQLGFQDETPGFLYLTSIYWAVTTIATVGFGDIHAENELE
jgi:hyperpolarization activated cyclic nucleotide-gated potassium channel 1